MRQTLRAAGLPVSCFLFERFFFLGFRFATRDQFAVLLPSGHQHIDRLGNFSKSVRALFVVEGRFGRGAGDLVSGGVQRPVIGGGSLFHAGLALGKRREEFWRQFGRCGSMHAREGGRLRCVR